MAQFTIGTGALLDENESGCGEGIFCNELGWCISSDGSDGGVDGNRFSACRPD